MARVVSDLVCGSRIALSNALALGSAGPQAGRARGRRLVQGLCNQRQGGRLPRPEFHLPGTGLPSMPADRSLQCDRPAIDCAAQDLTAKDLQNMADFKAPVPTTFVPTHPRCLLLLQQVLRSMCAQEIQSRRVREFGDDEGRGARQRRGRRVRVGAVRVRIVMSIAQAPNYFAHLCLSFVYVEYDSDPELVEPVCCLLARLYAALVLALTRN